MVACRSLEAGLLGSQHCIGLRSSGAIGSFRCESADEVSPQRRRCNYMHGRFCRSPFTVGNRLDGSHTAHSGDEQRRWHRCAQAHCVSLGSLALSACNNVLGSLFCSAVSVIARYDELAHT